MARMERERATLLLACQAAVDRLVNKWGWQLLDRAAWAQQSAELVSAGLSADADRAAMLAYCQALHAACSGDEGSLRQNQAYDELFRYLFAGARRRDPQLAEDIAQRAIERVFARFAHCRAPGAFLAFAFQQLMDSARVLRQQNRVHDSASLVEQPDRHPDAIAHVIAEELSERFEELSREFLRRHPRARQQLAALRLKYIDGLDDAVIGRLLGKPPGSIYTLRARAVEKLRAEPEWRALAVEFGILPDE
jgi:RNA polymerase sigma factor (sigma-70 family)